MNAVANPLRRSRTHHVCTRCDIAKSTGVGSNTFGRFDQESESFTPQLGTVETLAAVLRIRAGWLAFGAAPMLWVSDMTAETRDAEQPRPSTDGPPGNLVFEGVLCGTMWTYDGMRDHVSSRDVAVNLVDRVNGLVDALGELE